MAVFDLPPQGAAASAFFLSRATSLAIPSAPNAAFHSAGLLIGPAPPPLLRWSTYGHKFSSLLGQVWLVGRNHLLFVLVVTS